MLKAKQGVGPENSVMSDSPGCLHNRVCTTDPRESSEACDRTCGCRKLRYVADPGVCTTRSEREPKPGRAPRRPTVTARSPRKDMRGGATAPGPVYAAGHGVGRALGLGDPAAGATLTLAR